jgi:hypothetical protein
MLSPATVLLAAALAAPVPQGRLVCEVPARKVVLAELSLPEGSRPRDMALTRSTVWILFQPALLVGLPRLAPAAGSGEFGALDEVEMIYGARGDSWDHLSISPRDGSLWIASATAARLWRKPELGRVRPVRMPAVQEGGIHDLMAGWDGIYIAPAACNGSSLVRVDTSGKTAGTALPREGCPKVDLETDWSGRRWALLPETGEAFLLSSGDRWQPAGDRLAAPVPWPEQGGPFQGWFFWGDEPVGIGGDGDGGGKTRTVLVRRGRDGIQASWEDCGEGNRLLRVAGDSRGWAALTQDWLLLGEHALESRD